jgi:hypothetical protein
MMMHSAVILEQQIAALQKADTAATQQKAQKNVGFRLEGQ